MEVSEACKGMDSHLGVLFVGKESSPQGHCLLTATHVKAPEMAYGNMVFVLSPWVKGGREGGQAASS